MVRKPPGLIVTMVAAMFFDARKLVLSASRTDPLFVSWIVLNWSALKTKGFGGLPAVDAIWASTSASGGAGVLLW